MESFEHALLVEEFIPQTFPPPWIDGRKTIRDATMEMCIIRKKTYTLKWEFSLLLVNEAFPGQTSQGFLVVKAIDLMTLDAFLLPAVKYCADCATFDILNWRLNLSIFQHQTFIASFFSYFPTKPFYPQTSLEALHRAHNIIYQSRYFISFDRHENWCEKNEAAVGRCVEENVKNIGPRTRYKKMKTRSR